MSSEILTMVGVILLLILASAFFSSAETAPGRPQRVPKRQREALALGPGLTVWWSLLNTVRSVVVGKQREGAPGHM